MMLLSLLLSMTNARAWAQFAPDEVGAAQVLTGSIQKWGQERPAPAVRRAAASEACEQCRPAAGQTTAISASEMEEVFRRVEARPAQDPLSEPAAKCGTWRRTARASDENGAFDATGLLESDALLTITAANTPFASQPAFSIEGSGLEYEILPHTLKTYEGLLVFRAHGSSYSCGLVDPDHLICQRTPPEAVGHTYGFEYFGFTRFIK